MSNAPAPSIETQRLLQREPFGIHGPIVVIGNRATRFVADGGDEPPRTARGSSYRAIRMPDVRGFELWLHLYAVDTDDETLEQVFWHHFQHTRWLLLASDGPGADRSWRRLFDEAARAIDAHRGDITVAIAGDELLRDAWLACGGREPLLTTTKRGPLLAALAKHVVRTLKRAAGN